MMILPPAPEHIETFKEVAVVYDASLPSVFNGLTTEERIFVYYLFRAGLPGNRMCADQLHRNGLEVITIFQTLFEAEPLLLKLYKNRDASIASINMPKFIQELKTFMVYLWANHGQYFMREHSDEKRTPDRLGLRLLTKDNVITVLRALGLEIMANRVQSLDDVIFNRAYEATGLVLNSIEQSHHNFYGEGFTEHDYNQLPPDLRSKINAYFYIQQQGDTRVPSVMSYAVGAKYDKELTVAVAWLEKAVAHARHYPTLFDTHLCKSLEHLIAYLKTGDEELFKQHSIEWLQSKSRVDYCYGFIESYDDPKSQRGSFQAEATIKSFNLDSLNQILPSLEKGLPVDPAFKRDFNHSSTNVIPNASINTKVFGSGHLGPMKLTAAYCLPNYEEIRSTFGSKQIIYPSSPSLGALMNPHLSRYLHFSKPDADWLEEVDVANQLFNDLWDIHCILHETMGHGSGKLATHTFTDQEPLTVGQTTYAVGETIAVTSENLTELLQGYQQTLEELRAEVIALYVSIANLEELVQQGFLRSWYDLMGKKELQKWLMFHMLDTGLNRMLQQSDGATSITGDHARANTVIMHQIIDAGGAEFFKETTEYDGTEYRIAGIRVTNLPKAMEATKKLLAEVQRIKSTADGTAAKQLIETYGAPIRDMDLFNQLKANDKLISGDLKCRVHIYPDLEPVRGEDGNIIEIAARWPSSIFEQWKKFKRLELETD